MTPDDRYRSWIEKIERIWQETTSVFWNRKLFRAVSRMYETNPVLREQGGHVWTWIVGTYGRDAVMAVRRELDNQAGVINLVHLLYEMEKHAHVLTRGRYRAFFSSLAWFPPKRIDEQFQRLGGPSGPGADSDSIAPEAIKKDREQLQAATRKVFDYAQRLVAHRTPVGEVPLTTAEIDEALKALFDCLRKYYVLLTGTSLATATPVPQFDWLEPFRLAWITQEFRHPEDEERGESGVT